MNEAQTQDTSVTHINSDNTNNLSALKQARLEKRKLKEQRRLRPATIKGKHSSPGKKKMTKPHNHPKWGELYPLADDLHSILTNYASIGIAGSNLRDKIIDTVQKTELVAMLTQLFNDINEFAQQLTVIRTRFKDPEVTADMDDYPIMFEIFEALDALRVDITTVLTDPASKISDILLTLDPLTTEPQHD
jgi:hypothetical protein